MGKKNLGSWGKNLGSWGKISVRGEKNLGSWGKRLGSWGKKIKKNRKLLSVRFRFANRNEITELSVGKPSTNLHQTKPRSGPSFLHNPLFFPLFGLGLRFGIFRLSSVQSLGSI